MSKLRNLILMNFRTKVLLPIIGVMALLMAVSMWLIDERVTHQLRLDASEELVTAEAALKRCQELRLGQLLATYRKLETEARFAPLAALSSRSPDFSAPPGPSIRATLEGLVQDGLADVITLVTRDGTHFTATGNSWLHPGEFSMATSGLASQARTNGVSVGILRVGGKLLDVVALPLRSQEQPVATLLLGTRDTLVEEIRKLARCEVLLLSEGKLADSSFWGVEISPLLSNPALLQQEHRGLYQPVEFNDEHFLALPGQLDSPNASNQLGYVLLTSYEKPLQVLRDTQQLIVLVSVAAMVLGIAIVWYYVRRVTEPLEDLQEHTEAIGRGDFTRRLNMNSRDEFGELAAAFNQMTENLRISRGQLEATVASLKATQAQLIQSGKLAGIGEFVAGVAHELNNPLTTIMGFSELLQQLDSSPQQKRQLEILHKSAMRCQKIVQNLLSFARRHKVERKPMAINQLVEAAVDILAYQLRTSNIQTTTELAPHLPEVLVDPHQLQQVFVNILNNARQAIENRCSNGRIHIVSALVDGRVHVTFSDDGPGIAPENLTRLFDPFFTTKETGKGTGLGLSICQSIIKEHGGAISVQSQPGQGAQFTVALPPAVETDKHTHNPARPEPDHNARSVGLTVLVVDDEEAILQMLTEILGQFGHKVATALDGESALRHVKEGKFDLVICDWKMPGLNGQQFYEQLKAINPALADRVIFMTGDVINATARAYLAKLGRAALTKPFSLAEFESVLTSATAAR